MAWPSASTCLVEGAGSQGGGGPGGSVLPSRAQALTRPLGPRRWASQRPACSTRSCAEPRSCWTRPGPSQVLMPRLSQQSRTWGRGRSITCFPFRTSPTGHFQPLPVLTGSSLTFGSPKSSRSSPCVCLCVQVFTFYKNTSQDFPGDPVAKTPCSQSRAPSFHPCSGN